VLAVLERLQYRPEFNLAAEEEDANVGKAAVRGEGQDLVLDILAIAGVHFDGYLDHDDTPALQVELPDMVN
jgi:hypothetical protein